MEFAIGYKKNAGRALVPLMMSDLVFPKKVSEKDHFLGPSVGFCKYSYF